jgi:poly(A) polymerase Pap1
MYPFYSTDLLLEKFFMIYSKWNWQEDEVHIVNPHLKSL